MLAAIPASARDKSINCIALAAPPTPGKRGSLVAAASHRLAPYSSEANVERLWSIEAPKALGNKPDLAIFDSYQAIGFSACRAFTLSLLLPG